MGWMGARAFQQFQRVALKMGTGGFGVALKNTWDDGMDGCSGISVPMSDYIGIRRSLQKNRKLMG